MNTTCLIILLTRAQNNLVPQSGYKRCVRNVIDANQETTEIFYDMITIFSKMLPMSPIKPPMKAGERLAFMHS